MSEILEETEEEIKYINTYIDKRRDQKRKMKKKKGQRDDDDDDGGREKKKKEISKKREREKREKERNCVSLALNFEYEFKCMNGNTLHSKNKCVPKKFLSTFFLGSKFENEW